MDNRPKYKTKSMKLLEENIAANLCDLGLSNDFFKWYQIHKQKKEKINKTDIMKIKALCFKGQHQISKKYNPQSGRKYLQVAYLVWNFRVFRVYKVSYISTIKKQIT